MIIKMPIISWFDRSTVMHLRLPFSFFLMPVFLFALSQSAQIHWTNTILSFFILHLLIFPSSNGYNSYQDKDETSIGGLKNPPKVTSNLYYATLFMDILAVLSGLIISIYFSLLLMVFVCMSRAYSSRRIRLKKYPVTGFFTVFIFQGAFVYFMSLSAISNFHDADLFSVNTIVCMCVSSLFIGSIYPLTQIYQHKADKEDGVISLSYKLGYKGTFIFSGLLFSAAVLLLFNYFSLQRQYASMILFLFMIIPSVFWLTKWFAKVKKDSGNANFDNTMAMNLLTSSSMNAYFILLILNRYGNWF